ncbi:MAG: hypothetical protein AB1679_11110 [Actinomycetota bacterium]
MPVVFFLNKLNPDISPQDFECWVREVDYPTARSLTSIKSYVVARTPSTLDGNPSPYDYVERVEVTDLDAYRHELGTAPGIDEFFKEWSARIVDSVAVIGEEIE